MKYRSELLYEYAKEHIRDEDVPPVFVPSYNRPDAKLLQRLFVEPEFPIVLCVRREQEEMYSKYRGKCPFLLLDNVSDLSETREAIVQSVSPYYEHIFMLDDDISILDYNLPSLTKNGKPSMRSSKACYGKSPRGIDVLKMWWLSIQYDPHFNELALTGLAHRHNYWDIVYKDRPQIYNTETISQCIHLNTVLLQRYDIHYLPMRKVGVEDYAMHFQVMEKGLYSAVFTDIVYDCPAINSIPGGCENAHGLNHQDRYKMYLEAAKSYYGDHPGVKFSKTRTTGIESVKFVWNYWRKT